MIGSPVAARATRAATGDPHNDLSNATSSIAAKGAAHVVSPPFYSIISSSIIL